MEKPNLIYIDKLANKDEKFKTHLIKVLKTELPVEKEAYFVCMQNNDFHLAAELVHKLKHKIIILGLKKSYYIADEYELNLKSNSYDLEFEFKIILDMMNDFVENL